VVIQTRFVPAAILALAAASSPLTALEWMGIDWTAYNAETTMSVTDGHLLLNSTGTSYGVAHYQTSSLFRAMDCQWAQVTFSYDSTNQVAQLWTEQETNSAGESACWTQFGAWSATSTHPGFQIYWWDRSTEGSGPFGWQSLGAVTLASHTLRLELRPEGTVEYWLDGALAWSTTNIAPEYFGDFYLAAARGPVTFTDFQDGGYNIPEPAASGLLLALGLPSLLRRRRLATPVSAP